MIKRLKAIIEYIRNNDTHSKRFYDFGLVVSIIFYIVSTCIISLVIAFPISTINPEEFDYGIVFMICWLSLGIGVPGLYVIGFISITVIFIIGYGCKLLIDSCIEAYERTNEHETSN